MLRHATELTSTHRARGPPSGTSPQFSVPGGCMSITLDASAPPAPPVGAGRIRGLACRECGQLYPAQALHVCEMCFGPLEVAYDYDLIAATLTREHIERGPRTLWRY